MNTRRDTLIHWLIQRSTAFVMILILWIMPLQSLFLINIVLFWHLHIGIEEILADYIHHEVTRNLILMWIRIFILILMKYLFVFLLY
jgi:complement component 1 Q subcomponent-binding protein